jgi:predicted amidophosphoribosyltransferase
VQRLHYKQQVIRQFAKEVVALLHNRLSPEKMLMLVPMPPSKARSHPEYDDRLEQVAQAIAAGVQNVECLPLLDASSSTEIYHSRSDRRDPDELYNLLQIEPTVADRCQAGNTIVLLDDVLTSGAHFTAACRRILERFPDESVIGIFWAKAVSAEDFFAEW